MKTFLSLRQSALFRWANANFKFEPRVIFIYYSFTCSVWCLLMTNKVSMQHVENEKDEDKFTTKCSFSMGQCQL